MSLIERFVTRGLRVWAYNLSGFNQLGLMRDDCLRETPELEEALRRLPAHIRDERNFRLVRAMQLDAERKILPKEQWTKWDEDVLYLQPYLQEVLREKAEKEQWEAEN
ncbi:cytochrome b-c1 complex subunit 7 [Calliopsis andreniformis]|uniref:cytochrome b-c1 complex subunit 7 n=1 Tax=Calliopsis andreniformis TaxID=337506 RepID=UPI003FCDB2B0